MNSQLAIVLPPLSGGQADSWIALVELAPAFGENWILVGGQMVFLHEIERQASELRPTDDIDVVVDIRTEPDGLRKIHVALATAGFGQHDPSPEGTAHRYSRGAAVIDVLAPDNVGAKASLDLGFGRTIEAPGTTQAFGRSGVVTVHLGDSSAEIRRPDLVGALLGKAAAVMKITSQTSAGRAKHLRDFDSLAKLLGVSDRESADLSRGERKLLSSLVDEAGVSRLGAATVKLLIDGRRS